MQNLALLAAILAAVALIAVAVMGYFAVRRLDHLIHDLRQQVESDWRTTVHAWADAGREVRHAAEKLEAGLSSLNKTLERVDRITEKLEPDSLARIIVGPAAAKLTAWVSGFRRGLSTVRERPRGNISTDDDTEEG